MIEVAHERIDLVKGFCGSDGMSPVVGKAIAVGPCRR